MGFDLKREFLRLLREDEEFRYAVMGLLGMMDLKSSVDNLVKAISDMKDIVAKHGEEIIALKGSVDELRKTVETLSNSFGELKKIIETLSEDVKKHSEVILIM